MNKQIARELHRRNIYGDFKAPHRYSTMCNSFGRGAGERKPDYRNVRHMLRLEKKHASRNAFEKGYDNPSHREVRAVICMIKSSLGLL